MKSIRRPIPINNRDKLEEITIAILGNANSGKSSMVGVLTNLKLRDYTYQDYINKKQFPENVLDNGNGSAREMILRHIHEQKTGRTSSVTYNHMLINEGNKIISFVDLAGHEAYLKTTINGITSSYPDYALVCVEKNITKITLEHIKLLYVLNIPFSIIMSKVDIIPEDKLQINIKKVHKYMKSIEKKGFVIKSLEDLQIIQSENIIPIILLSNKTGLGYDMLYSLLNSIKKRQKNIIDNAFIIDSIYHVFGYGMVVCGMSGLHIKKNDELYLGPFSNNTFIKAKVRTIHDDYRNFVDELLPKQRGCLCIKIDNNYKSQIRYGLVLVKSRNDVNPVNKFQAKIKIFQGANCTIKSGYTAVINTGVIRSSVRFKNIYTCDSKNIEYTRGDEKNIVEMEFLKNAYCINSGDIFIFREGRTIGYGIVL
jgi:elongation factor 1-alpha